MIAHITMQAKLKMRRVAIVHDWLTEPGGAEVVLEQMLQVFPQADLFVVCDFLEERHRGFLNGIKPKTTFIQRLPLARKHYRAYLSIMPVAIEQLDLSSYDLVISSSYAVAKGVITGPDQLHVSYVHSPMRYAWHLQPQYLRESRLTSGVKSIVARQLLHGLRIWDVRSSVSVDMIIANSHYIKRTIRKQYGREAAVVYPPVSAERVGLQTKEDFYFTASRLVPYKKMDMIIEAFKGLPGRSLQVAGIGPDWAKLKKSAEGFKNISLLGHLPRTDLLNRMANARAFIFCAIEDFGIAPIEAQACGTPVIGLGIGGLAETVIDGKTGVLFHEQNPSALKCAIERFERIESQIDPGKCKENANRFSSESFRTGLRRVIEDAWERHKRGMFIPGTEL